MTHYINIPWEAVMGADNPLIGMCSPDHHVGCGCTGTCENPCHRCPMELICPLEGRTPHDCGAIE